MAAPIAVNQQRPRRTARWHLVRLSFAVAGIASAWLVGFGWFIYLASRDALPMRHVDAIVVLTGGPDRVEVALRLLAHGSADRLLVSGAGEKTDLAVLASRAGIDPVPLERQIVLGRAAHTTRGNALETASWAHEQGIGSLLVVTAWFHMPRALIELRRTMPTITVRPYPVGRVTAAELTRSATMRRMIGEYNKYLAALAGLTASPFLIAARSTDSAG